MARKTGMWNRLLEVIGLVDDDSGDAQASRSDATRRVTPEDARSRYGTTSSAGGYSTGASRPAYSASAYGSSGRTANYDRSAYSTSRPDPYDREPVEDRYGSRSYARQPSPEYDRESGRYASASSGRTSPFDRSQPGARPQPQPPRRPSQEDDELEFNQPAPRRAAPQRAGGSAARRDNVVPLKKEQSAQMALYTLHTLTECRAVIGLLLDGKGVILNMEEIDDRDLQRAIDTLGGAAFALNSTLRRASDRMYLIAPNGVVDDAYTDDDMSY